MICRPRPPAPSPPPPAPRQAACIRPIFLAKVRAWADASGGMFPLRGGGGGYITCADAAAAGRAAELRFAPVKAPGRAVEKAARMYGRVRDPGP